MTLVERQDRQTASRRWSVSRSAVQAVSRSVSRETAVSRERRQPHSSAPRRSQPPAAPAAGRQAAASAAGRRRAAQPQPGSGRAGVRVASGRGQKRWCGPPMTRTDKPRLAGQAAVCRRTALRGLCKPKTGRLAGGQAVRQPTGVFQASVMGLQPSKKKSLDRGTCCKKSCRSRLNRLDSSRRLK